MRARLLAALAAAALAITPAAAVAQELPTPPVPDESPSESTSPSPSESPSDGEEGPLPTEPSPEESGSETEQAQQAEPTVTTQVVESFDGTPIVTTLFLPAAASAESPVPLVLRTHGWAGNRETSVGEGTLAKLVNAGYAVLTWDQRGFGCSGGEANVDKPDIEGRDVSALLDWIVAEVPQIQQEPEGDPVVGMTGGSYAGGIQLATATNDDRIDALAPEIAWSDLRYSLYENRVPNLGWGELLYAAGVATAEAEGRNPGCEAGPQEGGVAQEVHDAHAAAVTTNELPDELVAWFGESSLAVFGERGPVDVPTLVMQGSVDTLFDLSDGNGIYQHVVATGADARFVAFCGGHVACPDSYEDADDREHLDAAILTWFAKHLKGEDVDTGPAVEYRTNEGEWRSADDFTPSDAEFAEAEGEGELVGTPVPTGGRNALWATPSRDGDPHAMTVEVLAAEDGPLELVGIPTATLSVTGQGPRAHLFVKLVDRESGEVVNLQENPLRVDELSDEAQTFELDLSGIAYTLPDGHHLDLQVSTTSLMHANARTPSQVQVAATVRVPVRGGVGDVTQAPDGGSPGGETSGAPLPRTGGGALAPFGALLIGAALLLRRRLH